MKNNRAFTLIEFVAALAVIGVLMIVSSELFISASKATRSSNEQNVALERYDQMLNRMRRDVGASTSLKVRSPQLLELYRGDEPLCRWQITNDLMTRSVGEKHEQWEFAGKQMHVEQLGRSAVFRMSSASQVVLSSPALLLEVRP